MYRESGTLELPISYTTNVADLEKVLNKRKIYEMKHPTIKLLAADTSLADKGIVLLFLALTFMEDEGKLKSLIKSKNGKHPNGNLKMNTEKRLESVIEKKYNIEVEVEKKDNALRKKYAHLPITWATGKPKIEDFAGMWEGRDITLKKIREKAWKRH